MSERYQEPRILFRVEAHFAGNLLRRFEGARYRHGEVVEEQFATVVEERLVTFVEERLLIPDRRIKMSTVNVTVGHVVNCSLIFLDQNGQPMLATPTPDAPPTWTDTTPATGTLTTAPSGLTASEAIIAAGTDTIAVKLSVGGVSFSASVDVVASAAPQVLTTVQIATSVQ